MLTLACAFLGVAALALAVRLYQKRTNGVCSSRRRLDGRTALVTGGTAGMGLRIAAELARRGARVLVACPWPHEGEAAVRALRARTGSARVHYRKLDLGSLRSVRAFAAEIARDEPRLDLLVNNAGVGLVGDYLTKDDLNFIMQVNYFGHFLLTLLLLPLLRKSGTAAEPSRVINTSSILRHVGRIDTARLNATGHWFQLQLYGNSKLALLLFSRELARRLRGLPVRVNTVDPGAVGTNIFTCIGSVKGALVRLLFSAVYKSPWEGAQTALHVALDESAGAVSGELFKNCKLVKVSEKTFDQKVMKQLWDESVKLVKMSDEDYGRCFLET